MSRIGKRPVTVPTGVTATVEGQTVKMKGPKGQLQFVVHDDVEVKFENGVVKVAPRVKTNRAQAMYGTARAQVANLVEGARPGSIILAHDVGDPARLPGLRGIADLVTGLRTAGFRLVTVSELLAARRLAAGGPPVPLSVPRAPS